VGHPAFVFDLIFAESSVFADNPDTLEMTDGNVLEMIDDSI